MTFNPFVDNHSFLYLFRSLEQQQKNVCLIALFLWGLYFHGDQRTYNTMYVDNVD